MNPAQQSLVDEIRARFGEEDRDHRRGGYRAVADRLARTRTGKAAAILQPSSTEEVAAIVTLAANHGVALVPQGGNTSMVGGATPPEDGSALILESLRRMNRIRSVDKGGHARRG